jgi:hypothetical protein
MCNATVTIVPNPDSASPTTTVTLTTAPTATVAARAPASSDPITGATHPLRSYFCYHDPYCVALL